MLLDAKGRGAPACLENSVTLPQKMMCLGLLKEESEFTEQTGEGVVGGTSKEETL